MINLVIVTGAYGAGKTLAAQAFEEAGFYVTDRIPLKVVDSYFEELIKNPNLYSKVALVVESDIALETFEKAKKYKEFSIKFIGITCNAAKLNERYRLSRKVHPKEPKGMSLAEAIESYLKKMRELIEYCDFYIDTSNLSILEFRSRLYDYVIGAEKKFAVSFISFGYKISVPQDIETVFDVRLLPNPFWVPTLKHKTGLDQEVKDYVLKAPETKEYLKHVIEYLDFYLEELKKNDRKHAKIGFACSGGQHRSVAVAEYIAEHYSKKYYVTVTHKDLPKN